MKKPNIVLICVDQMRGDCMSNAGHKVVETPYLDTMARSGVSFDHAYSSVPSCIAARCAMFTGLSQNTHRRKEYRDGVPFHYEHTLAGELSNAGYHTQCVGKMHVYPTRNLMGFHNVVLHDGFLRAGRDTSLPYKKNQNITDDYFHWFKQKKGVDADIIDTGLESNSWIGRTWMYEEEYHPTNWVVTESIEFLRRRDPEKPFFLMSSFVRPHSPLDPPQFYYDMYKEKEIDTPLRSDWQDEDNFSVDYNASYGTLTEVEQQRQRRAYYACITHIDHQIGRLMQAVMEHGEYKNTVFIFLSDHGDLLGDHNLFRKALPYEGSTRIPLIIFDPGDNLKLPKGQKCHELAEIRDVMPTILDICGIEIPDTVDGTSLLHAINGEEIRKELIGQHGYGGMSNHYIVSKTDKYLYYDKTGKEQYFDLEKDRDELHDAIGDEKYKDRIEYLRNMMKEYMATETKTV